MGSGGADRPDRGLTRKGLELPDPEDIAVWIAEESALDPTRKNIDSVDADPATSELLDLPDEQLEIIEVEVVEGAPGAGRRVSEIKLPEGSLIISVLRGGASGFVPKPDTVIDPGDEVLVMLDPGLEPAITAQFASNGRPG